MQINKKKVIAALAYVAVALLACLYSKPVLAQVRSDFNGRVWEMVLGGWLAVTLPSLVGGVMRTVWRQYSTKEDVPRPVIELLFNVPTGLAAGWAAFFFFSATPIPDGLMVAAIFTAAAAGPLFTQNFLMKKFGFIDDEGKA